MFMNGWRYREKLRFFQLSFKKWHMPFCSTLGAGQPECIIVCCFCREYIQHIYSSLSLFLRISFTLCVTGLPPPEWLLRFWRNAGKTQSRKQRRGLRSGAEHPSFWQTSGLSCTRCSSLTAASEADMNIWHVEHCTNLTQGHIVWQWLWLTAEVVWRRRSPKFLPKPAATTTSSRQEGEAEGGLLSSKVVCLSQCIYVFPSKLWAAYHCQTGRLPKKNIATGLWAEFSSYEGPQRSGANSMETPNTPKWIRYHLCNPSVEVIKFMHALTQGLWSESLKGFPGYFTKSVSIPRQGKRRVKEGGKRVKVEVQRQRWREVWALTSHFSQAAHSLRLPAASLLPSPPDKKKLHKLVSSTHFPSLSLSLLPAPFLFYDGQRDHPCSVLNSVMAASSGSLGHNRHIDVCLTVFFVCFF